MKNRAAPLLVFVFALSAGRGPLSLCAQTSPQAQESRTVEARWSQDLAAWRAQREHDLAAPDTWLTLIGLEWLKPGMNSVGAAVDNQIQVRAQVPDHLCLFTVSGGPPASTTRRGVKHRSGKSSTSHTTPQAQTIQLLAPTGGFPPDLQIDGKPASEGPLAVSDTRSSTISWHSVTLVVLHRGNRYALRIKDANSPTRTSFHGLSWYAPDARFRVTAKWIPFAPSRIEKIPTVIGTTLDLPSPGVAEFNLAGKSLRLEPVIEPAEAGTLFFILRDETSQSTTYLAERFLHTGFPSHGLNRPGLLVLDFNKLENPPCAYTPYATCPLPPVQNRLPVSLEAGEKRYTP